MNLTIWQLQKSGILFMKLKTSNCACEIISPHSENTSLLLVKILHAYGELISHYINTIITLIKTNIVTTI